MTCTLKSISDVRAYWNSRPCNIRRSPAPVGSPQFFADTERNKYFVEPHIPEFAEFDKWADKRVLEIGCGIGIDTVNFAKAGAKVIAIDLSEESLKIALQRAQAADADIKFIRTNAEDLNSPFALRDYYDLVYAFGSIHHSPTPEAIVRNVSYVLKPGGTLKIMVYNKYSWKALWILLKYGYGQFWRFRELIARYSEAQTGCPVTHVYSKSEIRAMLERNGFHVRKMDIDHIFKFEIEDYKNHKYTVARPWRWLPDSWFRALEKILGWHLLIECTV